MPDYLGEALRQEFANPGDEDIIQTVELNHSTFAPDEDRRFVNGQSDPLMATLEAEAPYNGGEEVEFIGTAFEFILPGHDANGPRSARVRVDNVSSHMNRLLRAAIVGNDPIEIIFREYVASDLSAPQSTLYGLLMKKASVSATTASAELGWREVEIQAFPRPTRNKEEYPGLHTQ